jgi:aminotransferase
MNHMISKAVQNSRISLIREMSLRAARLDDVISLGIGEPDFDTPDEICQQASEDAMQGATHYTPSQGDPELVGALSDYLKDCFGYDLDKDNIIIAAGGMGALTAYFRTVLNPGDEVLVPEPYFPPYPVQIELTGGRMIPVPTSIETGFTLTAEAVEPHLTERSKVLLLNYPNNPTGAVASGAVLDGLARLTQEQDLLVVSDEVYHRFLYDGIRHDSIFTRPGMADRTVVIGSFSKSFAMTGWRVGYAFGPDWIIGEMNKVIAYYTGCTSSVTQRGGLAALQGDLSGFNAMIEEFELRRNLIYNALSDLPQIGVFNPQGAFYIFPNLHEITNDTEQFALDLLEQERVVVVPGMDFGASGADCVRIAFTVNCPLLTEAMARFSRFVSRIPS